MVAHKSSQVKLKKRKKSFHFVEGKHVDSYALFITTANTTRKAHGRKPRRGKAWYRNSFGGNRTFQQCFHTFAAIITAVETICSVCTIS